LHHRLPLDHRSHGPHPSHVLRDDGALILQWLLGYNLTLYPRPAETADPSGSLHVSRG
jgi:hypothetical protein